MTIFLIICGCFLLYFLAGLVTLFFTSALDEVVIEEAGFCVFIWPVVIIFLLDKLFRSVFEKIHKAGQNFRKRGLK